MKKVTYFHLATCPYCNPCMFIGKEKIYESHLFEKADECRMHVEEVLKRALEA